MSRGRPFPKGVSGNKSGRPRNPFGELIRKETKDGKELVDKALSIMRNSDDDDVILKALVFLRDTGWGKPVSTLELKDAEGRDVMYPAVVYLPGKP